MPNLPRPKGILFDLGDTLLKNTGYDLDGGIRRLFDLTDQATTLTHQERRTIGGALGRQCERVRQAVNYEVNFEAFHRNLFDRVGLTSPHPWWALDLEFLKVSHQYALEEGIVECLDQLQAEGVAMGVVSNSFHCGNSLEWLLRDAGLRDYFKFVIASSDYGFRKPHPELFETAIAKLGIPREAVWFIGDRPEADIAGAKGVGLTAVWYNGGGEGESCDPEPDLEVREWGEVGEKLKVAS